MWNKKLAYKSFNDYQIDRVLQNKRNLATVQSALTLYDKNNKNLIDQVQELIRENQSLRKQNSSLYLSKSRRNNKHESQSKFLYSKESSFPEFSLRRKPLEQTNQQDTSKSRKISASKMNNQQSSKISKHQASKRQNTYQSTTKKQNVYVSSRLNKIQNSRNNKTKLSHPRNAYLSAQQIKNLNKKAFKQARTNKVLYDYEREYENFKQKLNQKKQELKKSFKSKSNLQNSSIKNHYVSQQNQKNYSINKSRNVYLQQASKQLDQRRQLKQMKINKNIVYLDEDSKNLAFRDIVDKKKIAQKSPYEQFRVDTSYQSPKRNQQTKSSNRRQYLTSSAIKIQELYPENSVRIQEPKTKWKDVSQNHFQKVQLNENGKKVQNVQHKAANYMVSKINGNVSLHSDRIMDVKQGDLQKSHLKRRQRKKFLSVVSTLVS